jgi:hypothetical protein
MGKGILIGMAGLLVLAGFVIGPAGLAEIFRIVTDFVAENGIYFTVMAAGWTAWVCFCALLYAAVAWLIAAVRARQSHSG